MVQLLWKTACQLLQQLNIQLFYDPTSALLGIYPKERKIHVHTKICIRMFIVVLFIIAPYWKQPIRPSWMNGKTNCDISIPWNTTHQQKGMKY